jgi:hypothetical protein
MDGLHTVEALSRIRPVEQSILDTVADFARWGHLPVPA